MYYGEDKTLDSDDLHFIKVLQSIHDDHEVDEWEELFAYWAKEWNLEYAAP